MSITLTSVLTVSQGGSVIETDPQAANMSISVDFTPPNPIAVLAFRAGNVSGISLVPGSLVTTPSAATQISVDLTTGKWGTSTGQSGTLSGAALTSLNTTLKGLRNSAEAFAIAQAVIAGTQVAW